MPPNPVAPPCLDAQSALLQHHLQSISESILRTRRELAELCREQEVVRTRDELHAVVESTERATNTILTAAETVDTLARGMALRTRDAATRADAQAVQAQMQTVFEACNFQDLAGQRISKVVRTVVLVEERVAEMLRLWGAPAEPARDRRTEEEALLNGPALPGAAAVSQDAVDAMFG